MLCRRMRPDISGVTFGQLHCPLHLFLVAGELRQEADTTIESAGEETGRKFVRAGNRADESRFQSIAPRHKLSGLAAVLCPVNKDLGCCIEALRDKCWGVERYILEYRYIRRRVIRRSLGQMMNIIGRRS